MTDPIKCADCVHFDPWPENPEMAMGRCNHPVQQVTEYWFASELHRCKDHELTGENENETH